MAEESFTQETAKTVNVEENLDTAFIKADTKGTCTLTNMIQEFSKERSQRTNNEEG